MIDFTTVTREFRSLIWRRREIQTLLGSVFAGLGIFLQNTLQGGLPPALGSIQRHIFAFYSVMLMVPSLILALRLARLHGGLVINGVLFARLMQEQSFTRRGDPQAASRHNFGGVSFVQYVGVVVTVAFATSILTLALGGSRAWALGSGAAMATACLAVYFRFHHQAARFALKKVATEPCGPFRRDDWEDHVSKSLEDANQSLITDVSFVGLIVFSVFETLSGLGQIKPGSGVDLASEDVQRYGPVAYVTLMAVTCLIGLVAYLRVRVAVGKFSLQLDPTDRPFVPLRPTDSLLGYLVIAFLWGVSVHLLLAMLVPSLEQAPGLLLGIDAGAIALAILAEQLTLVVCARRFRPDPTPPESELAAATSPGPSPGSST